jgi:PAS domain S-box-containing protein
MTEEEQASLLEDVQRLRVQNSLLKTIVGAGDCIFVKDLDGNFLLMNAAAAAFHGKTPEEVVGCNVTDLFHPAEAEKILAIDRKVIASQQPASDERTLTFGSSERTFQTTVGPYRDHSGNVIGTYGIGRDVTERKEMEKALCLSDERFHEALVNTRHVLYRRNAATDRYDYISPMIEELTGYPYEEFLRYGWEDIKKFLHPDDAETVLRPVEEAARESRGPCVTVNLEYRMRRRSGEYIWLSDWTTAYYDKEGKLDHLVGSVYDITAAKQAEELLRENEERYRGLVELSPDAIILAMDGKVAFINAAGVALFGAKSRGKLQGRDVFDLVHPESREIARERAKKVLGEGARSSWLEETYLRLDGSPVPVEVAAIPFNHNGKRAIQVIARDITERKRMQVDMLRAQKLESLGVLAGGIAHDFNNMLTGVFGNLSLAQIHLDVTHPAMSYLQACERSIRQTTDLTRQLLTFARGGAPAKKVMDTAAAIKEAASFSLCGSDIRAIMDLDEELWCIEADGEQVNQAFHNFFLNAAQAMPGGGEVRISAVNETLAEKNGCQLPPGSYVKIEIQDRGCGIPRENLAKIFDPYFTTKAQGSGLGLASVYSIVNRHGGAVEVSSEVGIGSRFTVHLPALAKARPEHEKPKEGGKDPAPAGRILLMDDEEMIRAVTSAILQHLGYEVETCGDGSSALKLLEAHQGGGEPFAAVILDLTIPGGMGGKEAAARIRQMDGALPLIVSSGYSDDPVLANYADYGFSGMIMKPFVADQLSKELRRVLVSG